MEIKEDIFLSLVSYNVLFPVKKLVVKQLLDADRRYQCQFNEVFPELDADVMCLQEVTSDYVEALENSKFYKEGYQHTELTGSLHHEPLIVSKLPFTVLYKPDSHESKIRFLICLFCKEDINFIVINAHLIAYEEKRKQRKSEMKFLREIIKDLHNYAKDTETKERTRNAVQNNNIFLLGDLNLHFPGENKILDDAQFYDLWIERYSHFDGLTWDTQSNSMTKWMLPFDNRRMRLDRICIRDSKQIDFIDIKVIANKNAGRILLYPSDHFGLFATFCASKKGFTVTDNPRHKKEMKMILQDETGYRSIEKIVAYRLSTAALIALFIIYLIWKYIL